MFPCAASIRNAIHNTAAGIRSEFRDKHLNDVLTVRGGATPDGLKDKISGRTFYDLLLHYFNFGSPRLITGRVNIFMKSRVLFLQGHEVLETDLSGCASTDEWLNDLYVCSLERALHSFTFVRDCMSDIPCINGSSASSKKVMFCERLVASNMN